MHTEPFYFKMTPSLWVVCLPTYQETGFAAGLHEANWLLLSVDLFSSTEMWLYLCGYEWSHSYKVDQI